MKLIIILLSLYAFLESTSYGIYEYQEKNNKAGGVSIFVLASIGLVLPIFYVLI